MKAELDNLELEINSQQVKITDLATKNSELEALKKTQEKKIESLNVQIKTAQAQNNRKCLCMKTQSCQQKLTVEYFI